ncbi:hypothetical protein C8R44DRAFT_866201 [Mycena epipterygia]|nr:hypothetical protein C8R44DRAFT_866201 [Mycena epipterygia]
MAPPFQELAHDHLPPPDPRHPQIRASTPKNRHKETPKTHLLKAKRRLPLLLPQPRERIVEHGRVRRARETHGVQHAALRIDVPALALPPCPNKPPRQQLGVDAQAKGAQDVLHRAWERYDSELLPRPPNQHSNSTTTPRHVPARKLDAQPPPA